MPQTRFRNLSIGCIFAAFSAFQQTQTQHFAKADEMYQSKRRRRRSSIQQQGPLLHQLNGPHNNESYIGVILEGEERFSSSHSYRRVQSTNGDQSYLNSRRLAPSTGNNRVLIVRVNGDNGNEQTRSSLQDIEEAVFLRSPSAASQMEECSDGALMLTNAGPIEVTLPFTLMGVNVANVDADFRDDLQNLVLAVSGEPVDSYDHVMYCFPPGTVFGDNAGWVAFATLGGVESYYNDGKCEQILTILHELGHNYGLGHASETADEFFEGEYGDETSIMGVDDAQTRKCYNAPNSDRLGWYDPDYSTPFDAAPSSNILNMCLFGVGEYSTRPSPEQYQLWYRIGEIYVSFNRDAGPNAQTQQCIDQVVIHRFPLDSPLFGIENSSNLLTCLGEGEVYEGEGFVVDVESIDTSATPGCARVSLVVSPTPAPVGTLSPTITEAPSPLPTTELNLLDVFVENRRNDNPVTVRVVDSCGNVVQDRVTNPGSAQTFRYSGNEDQYAVILFDEAGGGDVDYFISYRGILQVANQDWNTASICHIVGDNTPRCDGISCGDIPSPPVPSPTFAPAAIPVSAPVANPTSPPQPVDTPTSPPIPGPTPPPISPTNPTSPSSCALQVRIDECAPLIASQSPIAGCSCYNYCDGAFLNCCASDELCPVTCPSPNFVAGCQLEQTTPTQAPTPNSNPNPGPTMAPFPSRAPAPRPSGFSDDRVPTNPPLPPSGDGRGTYPTVAAPFFFWTATSDGIWATERTPRTGARTQYRKLSGRHKIRLIEEEKQKRSMSSSYDML